MKNKKQRLRKECDALFKKRIIEMAEGKCEVCGSGFVVTAHHFIPRSLSAFLHFYLPNGVCLCRACHFAHHHKDDPAIDEAIKRSRGQKWFNDLQAKRREKHSSFETIKYYEEIIKRLNGNLQESQE